MTFQEWIGNALVLGVLALGVKVGVIIMSLKNGCCGKRGDRGESDKGCCGGNCGCGKKTNN